MGQRIPLAAHCLGKRAERLAKLHRHLSCLVVESDIAHVAGVDHDVPRETVRRVAVSAASGTELDAPFLGGYAFYNRRHLFRGGRRRDSAGLWAVVGVLRFVQRIVCCAAGVRDR